MSPHESVMTVTIGMNVNGEMTNMSMVIGTAKITWPALMKALVKLALARAQAAAES